MAYADPPYPGLAAKYYGDQPSFAGEVDHKALIASLEASGYDGWAQPARFEGELIGRKSSQFCAWLFDCLGLQEGDTLDDLFPGTGIVGRAWASLGAVKRQSPGDGDDASLRYQGDAAVAQVLDDALEDA